PSAEEVARELGMSRQDVEHTLRIDLIHTSLDTPIGDDSGDSLVSRIQDKNPGQPDERMARISLTQEVEHLLRAVSPREREVLRLYFGVCEEVSFTLDEIGQRLDLTRERVRQIKERALQRLRRAARGGKIRRAD
ncbi:MAG: sigma-70 family RNA polymerase sigma factor, partial [Chitinivibrionales bacterium]|nr:sigma-70 family RNA polymerase sigma factor [Chitinivibrionales bacterium]